MTRGDILELLILTTTLEQVQAAAVGFPENTHRTGLSVDDLVKGVK